MVDHRYTGVGYEPPIETPEDKDFMAAHIESLKAEKADLTRQLAEAKAQLVTANSLCLESMQKLNLEIARLREALEAKLARLVSAAENFVTGIELVHSDPEYQAVWQLYQAHIPTGYRGRKYTEVLDKLKAAVDAATKGRE